eukprot:XP_001704626.1 Hypothetical protein GL50803_115982 [Giardia lamblia ATCC 50803]
MLLSMLRNCGSTVCATRHSCTQLSEVHPMPILMDMLSRINIRPCECAFLQDTFPLCLSQAARKQSSPDADI